MNAAGLPDGGQRRAAIVQLLIGAAIIGTNGLMVRLADTPPTVSAFWRMFLSGILLALLVLPLYVPVLIFGAGACNAAQMGLPFLAPLLWLAAGLVLALVLAPLACAAALRISIS